MAGLTPRPILLVWSDAHAATDTWTDLGEVDPDPCLIRTVGFLVDGVKPGHVTVAQSLDDSDRVDSLLCVPEAMVVRLEHLPSATLDAQPTRRRAR